MISRFEDYRGGMVRVMKEGYKIHSNKATCSEWLYGLDERASIFALADIMLVACSFVAYVVGLIGLSKANQGVLTRICAGAF